MAGTKIGGIKAAATNKQRYGLNFYPQIGRKGGKISSNREWALSPEGNAVLAEAGRKGGKVSRRSRPKCDICEQPHATIMCPYEVAA